jgi:hypothetical protein
MVSLKKLVVVLPGLANVPADIYQVYIYYVCPIDYIYLVYT